MNIIPMNIAVESATCDGCGAEASLRVISAGRDHGLPDGADLFAYATTLPDGWVAETRQGAEESKRTLCVDCAGTVKQATEAAVSTIAKKNPIDPKLGGSTKIPG
jgi:hypothetical protein